MKIYKYLHKVWKYIYIYTKYVNTSYFLHPCKLAKLESYREKKAWSCVMNGPMKQNTKLKILPVSIVAFIRQSWASFPLSSILFSSFIDSWISTVFPDLKQKVYTNKPILWDNTHKCMSIAVYINLSTPGLRSLETWVLICVSLNLHISFTIELH
jgi:hypothetical protein